MIKKTLATIAILVIIISAGTMSHEDEESISAD